MTNAATKRALEHAERLARQWQESGEEPTQDEWLEAARDVAELIPPPVGPVADLALTIYSFASSMCRLFSQTRDERAAALGSVSGMAAYEAMRNASPGAVDRLTGSSKRYR